MVESKGCIVDHLYSLGIPNSEIDYSRTPISPSRPDQQYSLRAKQAYTQGEEDSDPILTVLTATHNTKEVFHETATVIREQSLRSLRWVIVDDHSDSVQSLDRLRQAKMDDQRIIIVNNTDNEGVSHCRQAGLEYLRKNPTKYFAFIDDDDLFELTGYEKCVLMLESSTNIHMCGFYSTGFGERNYTWWRGFHNGAGNLYSNTLTNGYVVRSSALFESNCKFESEFNGGMEDWEFLLCLAAHGKWGSTVPEVMHWYRQNPTRLRETKWPLLYAENEKATLLIQQKYEPLLTPFPALAPNLFTEDEEIKSIFSFKNFLTSERGILLVMDSFSVTEKNVMYVDLVRTLVAEGRSVTVVCTSSKTSSTDLRPVLEHYTTDIFVLPYLMRLVDSPRFFKYIIESRNAKIVLLDRSQIGYLTVPWLSVQLKDVVLAAFVDDGDLEWIQKGFMSFFGNFESYIDYLVVPTSAMKSRLAKHGFTPDRIVVHPLASSTKKLAFVRKVFRKEERVKLGIESEAFVLLYVGNGFVSHMLKYVLEAYKESITKNTSNNASKKTVFHFLSINSGLEPAGVTSSAAGQKLILRFFDTTTSESIRSLVEFSDVICFANAQDGVTMYYAGNMSSIYDIKKSATEGSAGAPQSHEVKRGVKSKGKFVDKLQGIIKSSISLQTQLMKTACHKGCCEGAESSPARQLDITSLFARKRREANISTALITTKLRHALAHWAEDLQWASDYATVYSRIARNNMTTAL
ncbi:putative glycosyltransferase [Gracilariopsis chorda]|uniref:Putative glycosyltransferase n=1 Tax=Gracilariopsis chorda TaxID=448386 RepID=A0A2V3IEP6_9FLOR|nr:putative glycosyltransferase [Gracilariopsis chorda]|eukprot:PXF40521.1 putative glycosyltransferase [Gracilariopsis chorda]